ncbi:hypothetical protein DFH09DRAFT_1095895 [Mycena vulgaris]|nr:hypothetical protein DFH09DRAFT_1095895 [Mycena vulgaris]
MEEIVGFWMKFPFEEFKLNRTYIWRRWNQKRIEKRPPVQGYKEESGLPKQFEYWSIMTGLGSALRRLRSRPSRSAPALRVSEEGDKDERLAWRTTVKVKPGEICAAAHEERHGPALALVAMEGWASADARRARIRGQPARQTPCASSRRRRPPSLHWSESGRNVRMSDEAQKIAEWGAGVWVPFAATRRIRAGGRGERGVPESGASTFAACSLRTAAYTPPRETRELVRDEDLGSERGKATRLPSYKPHDRCPHPSAGAASVQSWSAFEDR